MGKPYLREKLLVKTSDLKTPGDIEQGFGNDV